MTTEEIGVNCNNYHMNSHSYNKKKPLKVKNKQPLILPRFSSNKKIVMFQKERITESNLIRGFK